MEVIRRLIEGAPARLAAGGSLLVEIGEDQGEAVRSAAEPLFRAVEIHRDLAGHPRVLEARR
jgi:release factor glutamine methyltransferase